MRDFIYVNDVENAYLVLLNEIDKMPEFSEFDVEVGALASIKELVINAKRVYERVHGERQLNFNFGSVAYKDGKLMTSDNNIDNLMRLGWKAKTSHRKWFGDFNK